jgi:drug/metabolite transporter (DMT)-like permease
VNAAGHDEMTMAFTDRSHIARKYPRPSPGRIRELFAAILLVALTAALALRAVLSLDALAPAVATLLFAFAAATAGIALLCRRERLRMTWFDIAGVLTFVGVAISILIEPDQMVRLITLSEQPD